MLPGFSYCFFVKKMSRFVLGIFILLLACHGKQLPQNTELFHTGRPMGTVSSQLKEASGLVASIANPGMLWAHNDSGNPAEIFLIDTLAQIKMVCRLANIKNRDWEDIAIGTGPDSTKHYIYVADIGDNDARYPVKILYRFEEPLLTQESVTITSFDTLYLKLDDGTRDAEAIMIDPLEHGMYLLSKREDSVHFYKVNYPYEGDTLNARFRVKLPYRNINAAEISPDGTEVVIKDYENIYYWHRPDAGKVSHLLQTPPVVLPYQPEKQGEAITFARDGSGYYTLSESKAGQPARLMFYPRK